MLSQRFFPTPAVAHFQPVQELGGGTLQLQLRIVTIKVPRHSDQTGIGGHRGFRAESVHSLSSVLDSFEQRGEPLHASGVTEVDGADVYVLGVLGRAGCSVVVKPGRSQKNHEKRSEMLVNI